ncbi:MAG TPA: hypothetical protein VNJ06_11310 [Gemmatimonadales bacterium]|nr:hypothetical protein [Gemmatimonadales bacterium]
MKIRTAVPALALAVVLAACGEPPLTSGSPAGPLLPQIQDGSGLVLHSLTGLSLPLIGHVGDVNVDQAIITHIDLVENTVGQIVGLRANGVLQLTGGVLGTDVVTEDFATEVAVTPSDPQCQVLSINLGPITIDALAASVDVPAASVEVDASGAVGQLLCQLTSLLGSGASTSQVQDAVNSINEAL